MIEFIGLIKLIGLNSLEAGMLVLKDVGGHPLKGLSLQNDGEQAKKNPLHHKNIAIFSYTFIVVSIKITQIISYVAGSFIKKHKDCMSRIQMLYCIRFINM